jgi:hypothetical protein
MELIPYSQFAKLRLRQFVAKNVEISKTDGWEWMEGYWINEGAYGFTSFSREEDTTDETGGLEMDFSELPKDSAQRLLDAIRLPLRAGMKLKEVYAVLGEPKKKDTLGKYVHDRQTDEFEIGFSQSYHVSCTVHKKNGLIYLSVIRGDVLKRIRKKEAAFQAKLKSAQTS